MEHGVALPFAKPLKKSAWLLVLFFSVMNNLARPVLIASGRSQSSMPVPRQVYWPYRERSGIAGMR
jgi:hypothetical protein